MPPLPALQVRVPNSANALLSAENILGARQQRNALMQQEQRRQQIGNLMSGDLTDPNVRQQVQSKAFAIDPTAGAQIQQMFRGMNADEREQTARDAEALARAFVGVNDQPSFDAARATLPERLQAGVGTAFRPEGVDAMVRAATPLAELIRAQQGEVREFDDNLVRVTDEGVETLARGRPTAPTPRTDLGKINADLNAGLTTPAQALLQTQQALAPSEQWRPATDEERQTYGVPEGQGAQISSTGKVSTVGRGGGITLYGREGNILAQVGGTPLTASQTGAQGIEIAEEIRSTNTRLSELNSALTSLQANPQAAGLSGIAIERIGGVAEQVANLTGVDGDWLGTAPVQETRTQLSSLLGQYIPTITGDESGRYSDRDVQRAEAALPATRATASFQQVQSSLLTLQDIERRARGRALMRLDGFAPNVDITYPAGQLSYVRQLQREGKSFEEAGNIVADLLLKYDLPLEIVGIQ